MPIKKLNRALAIDPGSRLTGYAIMEGHELIYYGVKTFTIRNPISRLLKDVNQTMTRLINDYRPQSLAIESTFFIKTRAPPN